VKNVSQRVASPWPLAFSLGETIINYGSHSHCEILDNEREVLGVPTCNAISEAVHELQLKAMKLRKVRFAKHWDENCGLVEFDR
jgi:hypothetical protein